MKTNNRKKLSLARVSGMRRVGGFTLIELMIVLAIVAILAAIAVPTYASYVKKSRAKSAGADLAALSLNYENTFQRTLTYPAYTDATTNAVIGHMDRWAPSMSDFFEYSTATIPAGANAGAVTGYTLMATGKGAMLGCDLDLNSANVKHMTSGSACGGATW